MHIDLIASIMGKLLLGLFFLSSLSSPGECERGDHREALERNAYQHRESSSLGLGVTGRPDGAIAQQRRGGSGEKHGPAAGTAVQTHHRNASETFTR